MSQTQPNPKQLAWLEKTLTAKLNISDWQLGAPIADASFRAYSRITHSQGSYMLMYFPPEQEDGKIIVESEKFLEKNNIRVPHLIDYDLSIGAVLQEDMGSELLSHYNDASADKQDNLGLYQQSLQQLDMLQQLDAAEFGYFDQARQLAEMNLFSEWFVGKWLNLEGSVDLKLLDDLYAGLATEILTAPQCCIHLDFHSRNLCVLDAGGGNDADKDGVKEIGVLDYQDLLQGHFCYDIWSLLKDAYVKLPEAMSEQLLQDFSRTAQQRFAIEDEYVALHFNLIGLQRCLKVCGIFSRLFLRDGKDSYLQHIPLVLEHLEGAVSWLADNSSLNHFASSGRSNSLGLQDSIKAFGSMLPQLKDAVTQKLQEGAE